MRRTFVRRTRRRILGAAAGVAVLTGGSLGTAASAAPAELTYPDAVTNALEITADASGPDETVRGEPIAVEVQAEFNQLAASSVDEDLDGTDDVGGDGYDGGNGYDGGDEGDGSIPPTEPGTTPADPTTTPAPQTTNTEVRPQTSAQPQPQAGMSGGNSLASTGWAFGNPLPLLAGLLLGGSLLVLAGRRTSDRRS